MAPRGSSYGGGAARGGNLLQQLYSLSGRATLSDLPWLYGQAGGLAGGGQEKNAAGGAEFQGAEPAPEGAGPGAGGSYGSQAGLPAGGELMFPADTSPNPSAYNPAFRRPADPLGGQGGTSGDVRLGASADLSLGNLAEAAKFGLGIMSGTGALGLGLQGMGYLAGVTGSPLPDFTGEFNARDFLSAEEIAAFQNEQNPTKKRQMAAQLQALAQQRRDQQVRAGYEREWNAPPGSPGDMPGSFAPPGTIMGQDIARNKNALAGMYNGGGTAGGNAGGRQGESSGPGPGNRGPRGGGAYGGMGGVGSYGV